MKKFETSSLSATTTQTFRERIKTLKRGIPLKTVKRKKIPNEMFAISKPSATTTQRKKFDERRQERKNE